MASFCRPATPSACVARGTQPFLSATKPTCLTLGTGKNATAYTQTQRLTTASRTTTDQPLPAALTRTHPPSVPPAAQCNRHRFGPDSVQTCLQTARSVSGPTLLLHKRPAALRTGPTANSGHPGLQPLPGPVGTRSPSAPSPPPSSTTLGLAGCHLSFYAGIHLSLGGFTLRVPTPTCHTPICCARNGPQRGLPGLRLTHLHLAHLRLQLLGLPPHGRDALRGLVAGGEQVEGALLQAGVVLQRLGQRRQAWESRTGCGKLPQTWHVYGSTWCVVKLSACTPSVLA